VTEGGRDRTPGTFHQDTARCQPPAAWARRSGLPAARLQRQALCGETREARVSAVGDRPAGGPAAASPRTSGVRLTSLRRGALNQEQQMKRITALRGAMT